MFDRFKLGFFITLGIAAAGTLVMLPITLIGGALVRSQMKSVVSDITPSMKELTEMVERVMDKKAAADEKLRAV